MATKFTKIYSYALAALMLLCLNTATAATDSLTWNACAANSDAVYTTVDLDGESGSQVFGILEYARPFFRENLYFVCIGTKQADGKPIKWNTATKVPSIEREYLQPPVAVLIPKSKKILVVFPTWPRPILRGNYKDSALYSTIITIDDNNVPVWNKFIQFSKGWHPKLAINNEGKPAVTYLVSLDRQMEVGQSVEAPQLVEAGQSNYISKSKKRLTREFSRTVSAVDVTTNTVTWSEEYDSNGDPVNEERILYNKMREILEN